MENSQDEANNLSKINFKKTKQTLGFFILGVNTYCSGLIEAKLLERVGIGVDFKVITGGDRMNFGGVCIWGFGIFRLCH